MYEYDSSSKSWNQLNDIMRNGDCDNWFGHSLAFTHEQGLMIGCPQENERAGAVYYYVQSDTSNGKQYVLEQKIMPSDGEPYYWFGNDNQI